MQPKRTRRPKGKGDRAKLRQGGFTLVELMIALVVVSVVMAAGFSLTMSMSNGFRSQRQVQRVESNARIVLDLMASGIRAASPGLSGGQINDPCAAVNPVDTISVTNSTTGSDEISLIYASGGALASIDGNQDISAGVLVVDDNTDFEPELFTPAVIVDPSNGLGHLIEVFASSADPTSLDIRAPGDCASLPSQAYPTGSFVVRAVHETWSVDDETLILDPDGDTGPLDPEPVAEGIEEIQIAIGVENGIDENSLTDTGDAADEWYHNSDLDPDISTVLADGISSGKWRALRISVIAKETRVTDERATFLRPAVEDRPASTVPDTFRRRTLTTTVELRNFDKD